MKKIIILYSILLATINLNAQIGKLMEADKKYEKYSYVDAIKIYEEVADKGYESPELFQKLGNAYYFNSNLLAAAKWYKKLFALNPEQEPIYYFRYAQALKSQEEYEESDKYMQLFFEKNPEAKSNYYNENYLNDIEINSGKFTVHTTNINTEFSEFGPAFYKENIVFSSSRKEGAVNTKVNPWTKQYFRDLYLAEKNQNYELNNVENFSLELNSKYNESTPVFTKDGNTVYFTRNNFLNGKKGKADDKSTLIKIYKAELINGKWTNILELPFCSDNYSTAHPALPQDGKELYFVSDMPGGLGNSDIYKVTILPNGSYGKPINLGQEINTPEKESFPFIDYQGNLYFASNGYPGLGGLDIYFAKKNGFSFEKPINMGKPINSPLDDFSLIIDRNYKGYFSSNRIGTKGFDDIYFFTKCNYIVEGIVTDKITKEIIFDAKIEIFNNSNNKLIFETTTNSLGKYFAEVDCRENYTIRASKIEFESDEKVFVAKNADNKSEINLELERNVFKVSSGTDLAIVFDISQIYFDLDKWDIRPDAAKDLEKIIAVMKQNPQMKVDIRSHTDSRQTHKYNELLSERRAKSTMEFMIKNGIEKERLTAKGYGETQLVNDCADGVPCTEEQHQMNRRSEFIVVKMD